MNLRPLAIAVCLLVGSSLWVPAQEAILQVAHTLAQRHRHQAGLALGSVRYAAFLLAVGSWLHNAPSSHSARCAVLTAANNASSAPWRAPCRPAAWTARVHPRGRLQRFAAPSGGRLFR